MIFPWNGMTILENQDLFVRVLFPVFNIPWKCFWGTCAWLAWRLLASAPKNIPYACTILVSKCTQHGQAIFLSSSVLNVCVRVCVREKERVREMNEKIHKNSERKIKQKKRIDRQWERNRFLQVKERLCKNTPKTCNKGSNTWLDFNILCYNFMVNVFNNALVIKLTTQFFRAANKVLWCIFTQQ